MIRASACQVRLDVTDPVGSRERVLAAVRAAAPASDLVVLPELANSGYVLADPGEAATLAEPVDGPFVAELAEQSRRHGCVVVSGFAEADGDELYNSAVVLDRGEVVGVHRKVHLWGTEPAVFRAGGQPAPVFDTSAGRVGTVVCYDLEFADFVRDVVLRGAQVIAAPVNWPALGPVPAGERPMDVVRAQAMAALHRVHIVVADRCGPERGTDWVGGSVIIGPDGYPLAGPAPGPSEAILTADLDPGSADDKRLGEYNHVFDDRRPDVYPGARPGG